MSPTTFLISLLVVTILAYVGHAIFRRQCQHRFDVMAAELKMHYAQTDRFQLTPRVREQLPQEMQADLVVKDVLYLQDAHRVRYLFTVECMSGDPLSEVRFKRAASLSEPRDRKTESGWSKMQLAKKQSCLFKQYLSLANHTDQ